MRFSCLSPKNTPNNAVTTPTGSNHYFDCIENNEHNQTCDITHSIVCYHFGTNQHLILISLKPPIHTGQKKGSQIGHSFLLLDKGDKLFV